MGSGEALSEALIGRRLDAMPELLRTVFLLRHLDGLDVAAIGAQLGLESEAVERQLARAMRVLVFGADEEAE
jgi:DNA-directed RNA polymerase specialized sigma24 family protein